MSYDLTHAFLVERHPTLTFDPEADAAYIMVSAEDSERVIQIAELGLDMNVDLDADGRLVGIEILGAKSLLGL